MSEPVSSVTPEQLRRLRGMIGEPTAETYNDAYLTSVIEQYAILDWLGEEPVLIDSALTNQQPTFIVNPQWVPTYDLHSAASQIWQEKAAVWIEKYSFSDSGQSFQRSEVYTAMMARVRFHDARRNPRTLEQKAWSGQQRQQYPSYIVNAPEHD